MSNLSEREQRFSDLILPIRDLAINWDIDIATHLEEYLDELESIKFSVKGDKSNLNFAEAALLIQGSTAVYCRKVEYLHNLVLQALELVSQKNSQKNKQQQGASDAAVSAELSIEERLLIGNDPAYLILDDIPEGEKIDLEVDHDKFDEARRMSKTRLSHSGEMSRASMVLMHSLLQEDHGGASLKLSSCAMDVSGALMIGGTAATDRSLLLDQNNLLRASEAQGGSSWLGLDEQDAYSDGGCDNADGQYAYDDVAEYGGEDQQMNIQQTNQPTVARRPTDRAKSFNDAALILLDPHEVVPGSRALKKGKFYKIPCAQTASPTCISAPSSFDAIMSGAHLTAKGLTNLSFVSILKDEKRKILADRLKASREQAFTADYVYSSTDDCNPVLIYDYDAPIEDDVDNDSGFWGGGNDYDQGYSNDVAGSVTEAAEHNVFMSEQEELAQRVQKALEETTFLTQTNTYESLCKRHIDNFMRGAEIYARETGLSARVTQWTQKLEPLLDEQEQRPQFDLHNYADTVLSNIDINLKTSKKIGKKDTTTLDFGEIVQGQSTEEVCRMFLACLQLANQGNVSVLPPVEREMDSAAHTGAFHGTFGLKLHSSSRRQDIENYRAPSVSGH